jgi:hypothetical protein
MHNADSARQYIDQKRIIQLAQAITTAVAYNKPEDPVPFIKQLLIDLKAARDSNKPVLVCFTEDNIKAMFTVLDPFNKGTVTRAQMEGALTNFGTDPVLFSSILGESPGPFKLEEFTNLINEGVRQSLFPPR